MSNHRSLPLNDAVDARVPAIVFLCLVAPCFLGLLIGCGGGAPASNIGELAPHGGELVFDRVSKTYMEVVKNTGTAPIAAEVAFYFYRDAYFTPYKPLPESGIFIVDGKGEVALEANEDKGALVTPSEPALFGEVPVEGAVIVDLGGKERKFRVGGRR